MKTHQILFKIDMRGEKMIGKKYKLRATPEANNDIAIGDIAYIGKTGAGLITFFTKEGFRIVDLTGFEEWEEMKEVELKFNEVLKEVEENVGEWTIENDNYDFELEELSFNEILQALIDIYTDDCVADILRTSRWYKK